MNIAIKRIRIIKMTINSDIMILLEPVFIPNLQKTRLFESVNSVR